MVNNIETPKEILTMDINDRTREKEDKILRIQHTLLGILIAAFIVAFFAYSFYMRSFLAEKYADAINMYNNGKYEESYSIFEQLGNYNDAAEYKDAAKESMIRVQVYQELADGEYE